MKAKLFWICIFFLFYICLLTAQQNLSSIKPDILPNRPENVLIINPPELYFGDVNQSEIRSFVMSLHNVDDVPLNISHYVTADDGSVNLNLVGKNSGDTLNYIILPQEMKMVEVFFTPMELGLWTEMMYVYDSTNGDLYTIPMSANVVLPLYISPPTGEFGQVALGQTVQQSFSVHNASDSTMNISHYVTADDGSVNLNLVGKNRADSLYYVLLPDDEVMVNVAFTALETGPWSNQMVLFDNISNTSYYVPLNAHVEPPLQDLVISPTYVNIGNMNLRSPIYTTIYFTNNSADTLNIGHYVTGDDSSVNLNLIGKNRSDSLYFTIQPGETISVLVTVRPKTLGYWSRILRAGYSNSRDWWDIFIEGWVNPNVSFAPPSIDFGTVTTGITLDASTSVDPNPLCGDTVVYYEWDLRPTLADGSLDLEVDDEDDRAEYLLVSQLCNDTLKINIHFTPQTPGLWSNELQFTELTSGAVYYVPLSANILPPPGLVISPMEVHFGNVNSDDTRQQTFTFTNNSDVPLNISHYVTADDGSVNLNLVGKSRTDSLYFTIQPHQTEQVSMTYTPQAPGAWFCNMYVYDFTNNVSYSIVVDAYNIPVFYASPPLYDFGQVAIGFTYNTTIQVINPNNYPQEIDIDVNYLSGDIGCIGLSVLNNRNPDSLRVTVPSNETLFVNVELTPQLETPGSLELVIGNRYNYYVELVELWIPGEKWSWQEWNLNFGTIYIRSTIGGYQLMDLIHHLNSGIDVSAYAASHPNDVSLTGRNRADSLYFHMERGVHYYVDLRISPQELGAWTDSLIIYNHTHDITSYIPLSAMVMPSTLLTNPEAIDFGNVSLGLEVQLPCEVSNNTGVPVQVGQYVWSLGWLDLEVDGITADSVSNILQPYESKLFNIKMTPQSTGLWTENIYFYDYTHIALYELPVSANVLPDLIITPEVVDFGNVPLNQTRNQTVNLHNNCSSAMNISHYVTADDGSVNLNLVGKNRADSLYYNILPGQSQDVMVEFSPQSEGLWTNLMYIYEHNTGSLYTISMNAYVEPAFLGIEVTPTFADLGIIYSDGVIYQTFIVTNHSSATRNLSFYVTADDGSVWLNRVGKNGQDSLNFNLNPNQSTTVNMNATPQSLGPWNCNMEVLDHNSSQIQQLNVNAVIYPKLIFTPENLNFGHQIQLSNEFSFTKSVMIECEPCADGIEANMKAKCRDNSVTLEPEEQDRADSLAFVLTSGDTLRIYVTFHPQEFGAWDSILEFSELTSGFTYNIPMHAFVVMMTPTTEITIDGLMQIHWNEVYAAEIYSVYFADEPQGPWLPYLDTINLSCDIPQNFDKKFFRVIARTLD